MKKKQSVNKDKTLRDVKRLLQKIQDEDMKAFEQLYNSYKVQVFNFCYSILKSGPETQEVVQDTFLKIWESRSQFDEIISFNGFLYRIAKNTTLNKIRKKTGQPKQFEDLQDHVSSIDQTESEVLFHEMREILDAAIEALPPKRQEIFRLSREEGLSYEEIAERLDISVNTVKTQMRKALSYLKSYLEWISLYLLYLIN